MLELGEPHNDDSEAPDKVIPTGAALHLPEIEYQQKHRIGRRFCLIAPARIATVHEVTTIPVSVRSSVELYHLGDGDRIVVVEKPLASIPDGITAVLVRRTDGTGRWQWHKKLADFEDRMHSNASAVAASIEASWKDCFRFRTEEADADGIVAPGNEGLRPPQIGALHSIGAHWSIFPNETATVVMPTGTGKTETMLCTVINYRRGPTLVAVPSNALRVQTLGKFRSLGLLRFLKLIDEDIHNPIVSVITKEPTTEEDLDLIRGANVVIGVMASLGADSSEPMFEKIAALVGSLFVDEAHHVASRTWANFRAHFRQHHILQFTATPFRQDGKLVDGRVIFNYPLAAAQRDGYFKPIRFLPVSEIDEEQSDLAIAEEAVKALRNDLASGLNHRLMARCAKIPRGAQIKDIYARIAPEMNPIVVHSEMTDSIISDALSNVRDATSRIVICVNMLGEGFDLPELKIAALHDLHKSLPVLLQFTGRFTRSSGQRIGDATVIANIADPRVSTKLERLYSENADWNSILSEESSKAAREHAELIEFLKTSQSLVEESDVSELRISQSLLRPKFSTIVFRCQVFSPKRFQAGLPESVTVHAAWYNPDAKLVFFVCRKEERVRWSRGKKILDRQWNLFVLFHDEEKRLLHISSSDKDSMHDGLAKAVGGQERIQGEDVFRCLGGINRLIFSNIGVRKHGRRNMSFAMYTGADVQDALTITETSNATKSNMDGRGWENGSLVTPGCSAKGRVWSKAQGTIPQLVKWAVPVGRKLIDPAIDASLILKNVLIPTEVKGSFPSETVLSVEWPPELLKLSDEKFFVTNGVVEIPGTFCEWEHDEENSMSAELVFRLVSISGEIDAVVKLTFDDAEGYRFTIDRTLTIKVGQREEPLQEYLDGYPLLVRYVDLKELEGNLLYAQNQPLDIDIDDRSLIGWDWPASQVDITVESIWKKGSERPRSVQAFVAEYYRNEDFELIFNDDDAGEAADLICLKETDEHIRLVLVHCKFSGGLTEGKRVKDVVEVSSQAVRSAVWRGNFNSLNRHMLARQKLTGSGNVNRSRFIVGNNTVLSSIVKKSRLKPIDFQVVIAQPGVKQSDLSQSQRSVLGSAISFLKQTVDVDLKIICSK
ncbi:type III restriction enzyme, res subunit [Nitrobacter hamburgensis X14]|uniref:Type III restriction enzyme, res subunit n=1 Tax=Nitrobacter hamburgensis (strain DSM 10229 / NCIMB 13809 / X14) TaxID=323097 RepID=Q1QLW2_NITHX|nr:DEAD/DEAH box helicase family protein [Nitrobacter hamburgensis]ABE62785.1 type III restriction enzyme, res subunit [Nitrobacter hamburgensis X14]